MADFPSASDAPDPTLPAPPPPVVSSAVEPSEPEQVPPALVEDVEAVVEASQGGLEASQGVVEAAEVVVAAETVVLVTESVDMDPPQPSPSGPVLEEDAPDPTLPAPPPPVVSSAVEPSEPEPVAAALLEGVEAVVEASEGVVETSEVVMEATETVVMVSESVDVDPPQPSPPGPVQGEPDADPGISSPVPSIATSLEIPALENPGGTGDGGGEWELLVNKVSAWFQGGEFQHLWQQLRGPLRLVTLLIGLLVLLRVYGSLVRTIDAIPLVGGLLELVGLIALGRFCATDLARSSDRQRLASQWSQRWQEFSGRS